MTQTLKKQDFGSPEEFSLYIKNRKEQKSYKTLVLNYLFRMYVFPTKKPISILQYKLMSTKLKIPVNVVRTFIKRFLKDLIKLQEFLNSGDLIFTSRNQASQIKVFLHRLYRLAPIFDYKRAKKNAKILKMKLDALYFWPTITTRVAIIIYVTDLYDPLQNNKIKQTNLRVLCNCSAYAFHRSRNKIGLSSISPISSK